jgi:hypothetical protein
MNVTNTMNFVNAGIHLDGITDAMRCVCPCK